VLKLYTQPCSKTASQLLLDVLETLVEKNLESPRYIACVTVDNVLALGSSIKRATLPSVNGG